MKLLYSLAIPLAVGLTAALFTAQGVHGWYLQLNRPSFTPPNWLFAPVWTLLYILMGVSLYMIWRLPPGTPHRKRSLFIFGLQLALNFCWSLLFFVGHYTGIALIDIGVLWVTILGMIISFIQVREAAGLLQVPYVLWVSFAAVLNFSIWQLNG
jgi:tryptophan-rich sensory protein